MTEQKPAYLTDSPDDAPSYRDAYEWQEARVAVIEADPLVWQGYGGMVYHRGDCQARGYGAVSWRRSFASAPPDEGLGLRPCKRCRPDVDDVRPA